MYNAKKFFKIQDDFDNNVNSHSYMFYTNDFLKCKTDLENLVKYIFKNDNLIALENDYVVIKRSDKKNILKEDMLDLKRIFQNTSYINNNRIYVIEEAHKLNPTSANMILKFLEEPMDKIVAFFITTNLDSVLSTIKSRTQIVNVFYEKIEERIPEEVNILKDFVNQDKYVAIFNAKNYFKKYDRNKLIEIFSYYMSDLYNGILDKENTLMIKKINKCISLLNNNVNVDYVFDYLFLEGD